MKLVSCRMILYKTNTVKVDLIVSFCGPEIVEWNGVSRYAFWYDLESSICELSTQTEKVHLVQKSEHVFLQIVYLHQI